MRNLLSLRNLLIFTMLVSFSEIFAASVTFLKIYKGTGSSYDLQTSSIAITTPTAGTAFKFTSANPAAVSFSGNNIAGQLSYVNNGNLVLINGVITRKESNSGNKGFYFVETTVLGGATPTGYAWFLLVAGQTVTENSNVGTNSAPPADELNNYLSSQSSNNAPIISSNGGGATASVNVNENSTTVTTVSATDADGSDTKTFSISGGVDAAKFTINSSTGALVFASAPNYENPTDAGKDNSYEVQVTVTDSKGATDVQTITVYVKDLNDNSPVINSNGGGATATVYVTAGTTPVTDNDATDADNDVLTYSISDAKIRTSSTTQTNPNYDPVECSLGNNTACPTYNTTYSWSSTTNPFTINASTGVLSFTSNATVNQYQITVTASDGSTTDTQVLTVQVTSTDTYAPTLSITASDNSLSAGEVTTIYFNFSEKVQGFTSSDVTIAGGTLGTIYQDANDPTLYYASFTQSGSSTPSVSVAANSYQDLASNNGGAGSLTMTLDTTAPSVTVAISTSDISYGATRTVTFTFSEDPGLSFVLTDIQATNGTMSNLIQDSSDPKIWTATLRSTSSVSGPTVTVSSGTYTDLAGNAGGSGTASATLAPPAIDLANNSTDDTGTSASDNYTSNNKPIITGATPSNVSTVTVVVTQGSTTYTYSGVSVSSQTFSLNLATATVSSGTGFPSGGLSDGTIGLQVTLPDASTASSSFIVDRTAPSTPTVTSQTTSNSTPTIAGTATVTDNDKLTVEVNGVTYTEGDGNLTIDRSANTWSLVIPTANALSAATYSVAAKVTDLAGNIATDTSTGELVISAKVSAADGNWGAGASWNNSQTPLTTSPVQIQHQITIPSGSVSSNNILLTSAGKLINQGNLTIEGNLVFSVNENSVSSQFKNTGTVYNNGKIVIRKKFTKNKWYYMSFPFDVAASQILKTGTTDVVTWGNHDDLTDSQIYVAEYDGTKRATDGTVRTQSANWKHVSPKVLKARHGYFIAMDTSCPFDEIDFVSVAGLSAPLNNEYTASEVYKFTSSLSDASLHTDWNLVGLPYLSSFQLSNATSFKPYYIYNNGTFTTVATGDSQLVYPFSAFYLQAYGSTNALDFASAGQSIQAAPAMNTTDEFKLSLTYADMTDETRIRLDENGTQEYQLGMDGTKILSPVSNFPQLYTTTNEVTYSLNYLPKDAQEVQMRIRTGAAGSYTMSLVNVQDIANYKVTLTDKLLNTVTDLVSNPLYTFNVDQTGTSDRFVLNILSKVIDGTQEIQVNNFVSVENKILRISNLPISSKISVYDMSGKLLAARNVNKSVEEFSILQNGIYIVNIQSNEINKATKVIIK